MTPRAALLPIALTGRFRRHSVRTSCAAAALLAALLLPGCATRSETPAPQIMHVQPCPEPTAPALPPVDGEESFDTLDQYDVFMERDDLMRGHIDALRRVLGCYRAQAKAD